MDIFVSAKKRLQDLGNQALGHSSSGDTVLDSCKLQLRELAATVKHLRLDLVNYAKAVKVLGKLSIGVGGDICELYAPSEKRARSVLRFDKSSKRVGLAANDVFNEQFKHEILGTIDSWLKQLGALNSRVDSADRFLIKLLRREARNDPESDTQRAEFEAAKQSLRADVQLRIDRRFTMFDAILVRVMECQIDFFTAGATAVSELKQNVANYRKLYPRGTIPNACNEPIRTSATSAPAALGPEPRSKAPPPIHRRHSSGTHKQQRAHSPVVSSDAEQSQSQSESSDEDETASDDEKSPARDASSVTAHADMLGFATMNVSENANVFESAESSRSTTNLSFGDMFGQPRLSHTSPSSSSSLTDPFDPFGASRSAATNAHTTPLNSENDMGVFDLFEKDNANDTKARTTCASSYSEAMPQWEAAAEPVRSPPSSSLQQRINAYGDQAVNAAATRIATEEKKRNLKLDAASDMSKELEQWEFKDSVRRPIRTLLASMHTVMWPQANFKMLKLSELVTDSGVKKGYRRALLVVHPDKLSKQASPAVHAIAEHVFNALTISFKDFNNE